MVKSKNESVLDLLISQRDENEYAKVESRMGIAVKIAKALKRKGMTQKELLPNNSFCVIFVSLE